MRSERILTAITGRAWLRWLNRVKAFVQQTENNPKFEPFAAARWLQKSRPKVAGYHFHERLQIAPSTKLSVTIVVALAFELAKSLGISVVEQVIS